MSTLTPPPTGGPQILWHELQRRWREILAGVLIGGLLAGLSLIIGPSSHTATATVAITNPSSSPEPAARSSLSSTDMVTEKGIATSATTLRQALNSLDEKDLTLADLESGLEVEGDTNGTIVTVAWSGGDRDQAVAVTNAITAAYIEQRTGLIEQRADEMLATVTEKINALNEEAAGLDTGTPAGQVRSAAIQSELSGLLTEQDQLASYHVTAARVLTDAGDSPDVTDPPRMRTLVAGLLIGLVLGLAIGFVRERREKHVLAARQLSDLTGLPVWGAQDGAGPGAQWDAPAQLAALAVGKGSELILLADGSDRRALAFGQALGRARRAQSAPAPVLVDNRMPLAEIVERLGDEGRILIGTATGASLSELHELLDQLTIADRDVVGLVMLDGDAPAAGTRITNGQQPQTPAEPRNPSSQGAAESWRAAFQRPAAEPPLTPQVPEPQPVMSPPTGPASATTAGDAPFSPQVAAEAPHPAPPSEVPMSRTAVTEAGGAEQPTALRGPDASPDAGTPAEPVSAGGAEPAAEPAESTARQEDDRPVPPRNRARSAADYRRMIRRQNRGRKHGGR